MGDEPRIPSIEPQELEALSRREVLDLIDVSTPVEYREVRVRWARSVPKPVRGSVVSGALAELGSRSCFKSTSRCAP